MKRLTLLALLAAGPLAAADPLPPPKAVDPGDSVVRVCRADGHGTFGFGTGTCIACENGKSLVVTNRHVCPDPGARIVVQRVGKTYEAKLISVDTADLAVLEVEGELVPCEVAESEPPVGAMVEMYAHPKGTDQRYAAGQWVGGSGANVHHTCAIGTVTGTSGGAVFYRGKVVAVHWGAGLDGRLYAVPLARVRGFVGRVCHTLFPRLTARLAARLASPVPAPKAKADPLPAPKKAPEPKPAPPKAKPIAPKAAPKGPPVVWYYAPPTYCPPGFA